MDKHKRDLKGSKNRDEWKRAHKEQLGNGYYGGDLDYVVVEFKPAGVVAFYDYKMPYDSVSNTEIVYYNALLQIAPLYIVEGSNPQKGPFKVSRYVKGHPVAYNKPPIVNLEFVRVCQNWREFGEFEMSLRENYRYSLRSQEA